MQCDSLTIWLWLVLHRDVRDWSHYKGKGGAKEGFGPWLDTYRAHLRPGRQLHTFKSERQSIIIWAGITYNQRTTLIFLDKNEKNGEAYTRNILARPLWDFYLELNEEKGWIKVIEDKAPSYTYSTAKNFRSTHLIDVFECLAQSLDMNPIEHL